jgi:hypothetical protein
VSEASVASLYSLALRLCKVAREEVGRNPIEIAKTCAENGYKETALLLLHIPLTHNLMSSAGFMLVSPWEVATDVCVLRKTELEKAGLQLPELRSFTMEVSVSGGGEEEEKRVVVRSESYYVAVLGVLDMRNNSNYRKAFVYYLAPSSGPYLQYQVFIILDSKWVELVRALCPS